MGKRIQRNFNIKSYKSLKGSDLSMQKTLVLIKPDAMKKGVSSKIIDRIKESFKIVEMKSMTLSKELANEHYHHVRTIPVFDEMIEFMTSSPILAMIVEGEDVISKLRAMVGKTRGAEAGTIRGDFGSDGYRNLIHASDSIENAEIEIKRFFKEE